MSTEFLLSLKPIPHDDPHTDVVEHFMINVKNVETVRDYEIGVLVESPTDRLYYYLIEGGVLEVRTEERDGSITRQVMDYITRPADVKSMLGEWRPGQPLVATGRSVHFQPPT